MSLDETAASTVIVTGAASGIGLAICELLEKEGRAAFAVDLRQDALEEACEALGIPAARSACCDVADEDAVDATVGKAIRAGRLAGIVNAAGIGLDRPAVETSSADFRRILEVNLLGSFNLARSAARSWLAAGQTGSIVNISSVSGLCGNKGRSAYGASKGGLNVLTTVMATELGASGIRVNAVAPGPIDTPLAMAVHTADVRRQWAERVPMQRYGTPSEVAEVVAFLLSDKASYINGQVLAVDGGFINAGLRN